MRLLKRVGNLLSGIATFLMSLLLAIIIWLTATQANDPTIIRPLQIPLEITAPSGAALTLPTSSTLNVTITIEGPASVLEGLTVDDFFASVDINSVPYGIDEEVEVLVQQIGSGASITSRNPEFLTIHLEPLVTQEIPVQVDVRGDVARGHSLGDPTVNPQMITVTGIESVVETLNFGLVTVFLNNDRETLIETRPLIFYDTEGQVASMRNLQLSNQDVEVTLPISESADFAEKIISVDLDGEPASGYRILSVNVEPSSVLVQGRPTQLDVLTNLQTEAIDITGLTETFVTPVSLNLPAGVELDEFTEIVVTVEIEPFQSSQTFRRVVEVQGLEEGLEAEITPELVRIVLFGPSPVLQSIAEGEVTAYVDVFGLGVGTHTGLEPVITFPDRGIELRSVEPMVLSANITQTVTMTRGITNSTSITPTSSIYPLLDLDTAVAQSSQTGSETTIGLTAVYDINKPQETLFI